MSKKAFIFLLVISLILLSSCTEDEEYTPVKKTGYDAPPVEVLVSQDEDLEEEAVEEEAVEEVVEEVVEEEADEEGQVEEEPEEGEDLEQDALADSFDDFEKVELFEVNDVEIIVREYPAFGEKILKYFGRGKILEVVDKIYDSSGNGWYAVRLFDYDFTYGFAPAEYLTRVED